MCYGANNVSVQELESDIVVRSGRLSPRPRIGVRSAAQHFFVKKRKHLHLSGAISIISITKIESFQLIHYHVLNN